MAKSKSPKKDKKKSKKDKKTSRDPYNATTKRGVKAEDLQEEQAKAEEAQSMKAFGPCHVDANECKTAILMLLAEEAHVMHSYN